MRYLNGIYQTTQIRKFERLAEEKFNMYPHALMHEAGRAACNFLLEQWPDAKNLLILCGNGNNGGDGYTLAHLAHQQGLNITIWQIDPEKEIKKDAKQAYALCKQDNLVILTNDEALKSEPDLIIDAIYGIGLSGLIPAEIENISKKIMDLNKPILALDIPSGVEANTGAVLGKAIRATATISFIGYKPGLLTGRGIAYAGKVAIHHLHLPPELYDLIPPIAEKIHFNEMAPYLKPRPRNWHKGRSGHILIIGGEAGYSGAPRLAAEAALRVGAGLVSVITRKEHAASLNVSCPEIMCHGIEEEADAKKLFEKATVIIIGPGLGQTQWSKTFWSLIKETKKPLVVDADALNLLSQSPYQNNHWILTPHAGEAARLLNQSVTEIEQDRLSATNAIQSKYGGICILKGAGTIILTPNTLPLICTQGNPGMASAGMGDVLSGVIGGLIGQGHSLAEAAKIGVCIHAAAGDLAAKEGERGLIATDLMTPLHYLANPT